MQYNNRIGDQGKVQHEIQDNGYLGLEKREEMASMWLEAKFVKILALMEG